MTDEFYMKQVLTLAKKGVGKVPPNPCVGALIVKNDRILSKGCHAHFGGAHAEINAIAKLSCKELKDATLYVNLEPCTHYGKTPPCVDTITNSGIKRVVIGMIDPNPLVNGKGIEKLQKNGIEVTTNILEKECREINKIYIKCITKYKPYITLKIAQTLDGKIAKNNGLSKWITSLPSRKLVHQLRNEHDAILIGINTVIQDNPELTIRWIKGKQVKRIILDSSLRIPDHSKILQHPDIHNTILITTSNAPKDKIHTLRQKGIQIWVLRKNKKNQIDLKSLWQKMYDEKVYSVFVEGGSTLYTSVLNNRDADRILIFIAPKIFGNGLSAFQDLNFHISDESIDFKSFKWKKVGDDMLFDGRL